MFEDLESSLEIVRLTERLLRKASAHGRLPTPVDDLVTAAGLSEPKESLLSDSLLRSAPDYIRKAIAPLRSKVQAILDRREREVHLRPGIEKSGQGNFKKLHEVAHDLFPWQSDLAYADDNSTLSWSTRILFEQEANQGSAELLFQREFFRQVASDYSIGIAAVIELSEVFGASIHATFRRYVETHHTALSGVVLERSPVSTSPLSYQRRESMHSSSWVTLFNSPRDWPPLLQAPPFDFLADAQVAQSSDEPVLRDIAWVDRNNSSVGIKTETFCNTYNYFVLLWLPNRAWLKRRRRLATVGS